ncbi:PREDICTED: probable methionine--tRNA ligase isoform X2 [Nelumbo nucifera]|uniref:tRNA-binding domain-containing protein n=2 Tax=Nelumbo nucifera TaxID=4432 RepID=A0A822XZY8_NELNU|nr:PREDICTED: probable methionine--tRNA ligase isoform X2 [Nelumbo nucifera]DAD25777.1 TPA_asm: hypothetical protein HUJ06_027245 [Nelumbo nucifera]
MRGGKEMESNGSADDSIIYRRKQAMVHSLCKRLSLDPMSYSNENIERSDIKDLFFSILESSGNSVSLRNNDEVMKWVAFASNFPSGLEACHGSLKALNEDLVQRSVLLGNGLKPSEVDILVFSVIHSYVKGLSIPDRQMLPNVMRWMDYIQSKEDLVDMFELVPVEKAVFDPPCPKSIARLEAEPNIKKVEQSTKSDDKLEANVKSKKNGTEKKAADDNKATEGKSKLPEKEAVDKDTEASVSLLNIQIGLIRKAWKHPSADSLLVEEIDLGDSNVRQVVSGLAKFCSLDELINRRVVLITNVKPGKLRDVMSAGLVLCASNQDHTVVEPLIPPEGAKIGERVLFSGHDGKPEDVINPKKKQLEKITPHLYTDDKGVATFKGIPFMTSAGPCTSSIRNASIK